MRGARSEWLGAGAVATLVMIALGALVPFLGRESLASTFPDDAFYYFQLARRLASGSGFTFDGLHATNGFQPLWLFLLVPVFALIPGDVPPLRAVALAQAGLVALAAANIFQILRGRIGKAAALVAALSIVALPGSPSVLRSGMESSLLLCLMVQVWQRWLASSPGQAPTARGGFGLGLLCGFAFLARVEAIVLLPALAILRGGRGRQDFKSGLALFAPPALFVAGYLVWNGLAFGTVLPISAMVKTHWAQATSNANRIRCVLEPPWVVRTLVCRPFGETAHLACPSGALWLCGVVLVMALAAGWRFRHALGVAVRESGAAFILLASGLIVLADKLSVHCLESWQEGPIVLSTAVMGGSLLSRSPRLARIAAATVVLAVVARVPLTAWTLREPEARYAYYRIKAADWVQENTAASDRIGSWNAGMFTYFSHRTVVSLDGLVNDVDYFRRVVEGQDLEGYLRSERIGWLADQACRRDSRPTAYLERTASGHLDAEFDLAFHRFRSTTGDGCPGYAVWRWRPREPMDRARATPGW